MQVENKTGNDCSNQCTSLTNCRGHPWQRGIEVPFAVDEHIWFQNEPDRNILLVKMPLNSMFPTSSPSYFCMVFQSDCHVSLSLPPNKLWCLHWIKALMQRPALVPVPSLWCSLVLAISVLQKDKNWVSKEAESWSMWYLSERRQHSFWQSSRPWE